MPEEPKANKDSEKLKKELERYLKLYSSDPKSRAFAPLAETYRKMGKLEEAIGVLEEGTQNHPNYPSGYISFGRCLSDRGDTGGAVEKFRAALKYAPDNLLAYKLLSVEYKKLNDEASLSDVYKKIYELSPTDEEALNYLSSKGLLGKGSEPEPEAGVEEPEAPSLEKSEESPPAPSPLDDAALVDQFPELNIETGLIDERDDSSEPAPLEETKLEPPRVAMAESPEPQEPQEEVETPKADDGKAKEGTKKLEFYTMTLAEVYLKQGLKKEAEEIYEVLVKNDPSNSIYREALAKLKGVDEEEPRPIFEALSGGVNREAKVERLEKLLESIRLRKRQV